MRWVNYVAHMHKTISSYNILVWKP